MANGDGDFQVRAFWRWSNFIDSLNSAGKPILRVNLDETSCKMHMVPQRGFVIEPNPKLRRQLLRCGQGADLGMRRSAFTLVAFACDDAEVQKKLPQVFIVNEHVATASDLVEMSERCPPNVLVLRRKSGWVNAALMEQIIKVLAHCIRSELSTHHVVLHMDTCPVHTHASVLEACSSKGLFVHFVPAGTTAWLQPLDVSAFSRLKGYIRKEMQQARLASRDGHVEKLEVLEICRRGVDEVLRSRGWSRAFQLCGLGGQGRLSKGLAARLCLQEAPAVGSELPSLADLQVIFPSRRVIPIDAIFQLALVRSLPTMPVLSLPRSARLP